MPRNWDDENWVKLYTRKDPEWLALDWKTRGLFNLLLEVVDRSGCLKLGSMGRECVAIAVRGPWAEIEPQLAELLQDGCVVLTEDEQYLVMPNFVPAQEAKQSPAARQRLRRQRLNALMKESPSTARIYFVQSKDRVCLSLSANIHKRLRALAKQVPEPKVIGYVEGDRNVARRLRRFMGPFHLEGEWFAARPELLQYLEDVTERGVTQRDANGVGGDPVFSRMSHGVTPMGSEMGSHQSDISDTWDQFEGVESGKSSEQIQQDELFVHEGPSRIEEKRSDPSVCLPLRSRSQPEHTHRDRFAWKPEAETRPNGTLGVPRGWKPADDHRAKAESLGLDVEVELERWRLHPSNTKRHFTGHADLHDRFLYWLVEAPKFGGRQSRPPTEPQRASAPPLVRLEAPSDEEVKAARSAGVDALTGFLAASTRGDDET